MRDLRALSLFTGAGGLDYGFEAAGFATKLAIELNPDACSTLMANRPEWPVLNKRIQSVSGKELTDSMGMDEREIDIVIGGPPCQPFSKAGYWARGDSRRLEDPRAETISSFMRVISDVLPRAFVLENVPGICFAGKDEGLQLIHKWIGKINREHETNYSLSMRVVNAAEYGVPQVRTRFILVSDRDGSTFVFPQPTHHINVGREGAEGTEGPVTAWDAIGHLDAEDVESTKVTSYWGDLLPSIPEGENYLYHTSKGKGKELFGYRTRYWGFLLKLAKARPSWTIQAQPGPAIGPFHWRSRRLSNEELARIQTFPRGVRFIGNRMSIQRQIGNAVPSLMAEVIARAIVEQVFAEQCSQTDLRLKVEPRRPIPPPEEVAAVPAKYAVHEGKHAPHPGEGLGPGVKQRQDGVEVA